MALNGTAPAAEIGRAVPLAFIFATVGVLFVSYAFIRLAASSATRARCSPSPA